MSENKKATKSEKTTEKKEEVGKTQKGIKDSRNRDKDGKFPIKTPKPPKFNIYWIYGLVAVVLLAVQFFNINTTSLEITYQKFEQDMLMSHDVEKLVVVNKEYVEIYIKQDRLENDKYKGVSKTNLGTVNKGPHYFFNIGDVKTFEENLKAAQENFKQEDKISIKYESRKNWLSDLLSFLLPIIIIIVIWMIVMRRVSGGIGGPGGQIFSIGKSKATLFDKDSKVNITFNDVAGLDEAKEEVMEVVDFLKNPKKYTSLGGKIPKGVLLVGPPGTGKTLLAKAVAGEAQVPFFSISGSDFVEMFVGVGASRVRDLFLQAKSKAPCIIFIDEIDAIGRARGKSLVQANDERENTLNALLVEMDGFATDTAVIIVAATNRPDVLDPALLRPGRFDRQISIDRPDLVGRDQIFKVHIKPLKLGVDVDTKKLAAQTPGFAGADIANVCNEAALIAARRGRANVTMIDFQDAIDRAIGGLEKKTKIISPHEKKIIAYHEAGHAICGWFLEHADPLVKVSIVPRGFAALGYAQYMPKEQYLYTSPQLMDSICMTLGGRAAELIVFGNVSTGAQNDLERITKLTYAMVTIYGMNERIGNVSFNDPNNEYSFSKPYSEDTARIIDEEVKKIIDGAFERTKRILNERRAELESLAQELLRKEILFQVDLERLIGKRPFEIPHHHVPLSEIENSKVSQENDENKIQKNGNGNISSELKEEGKQENPAVS